MISRSEFYTAHAIPTRNFTRGITSDFEFQTMICELTGMDVANSSMYDGGTALAEAAMLALAILVKILVSSAVHPESRAVLETQKVNI